MDLGAYVQIDKLDKIAKTNGIEIPRLRGYRLMSEEKPVTQDEMKQMLNGCEVSAAKGLIQSEPFWCINASILVYSDRVRKMERHYLIERTVDGYKRFVGVKWNKIHGKKRKTLKFAIKKEKQKTLRQWNAWNKYCGRNDVLYIHARIGGRNWEYFGGNELKKQPWFLEKVDDSFDETYCDIYAKIKVD